MGRAGSRAFAQRWWVGITSVIALGCALAAPQAAHATPALPNFSETTAFSGLDHPTSVRFAANGNVLVAEQRGLVKRFDSLSDTTPDTVVNLAKNVHNFWDRGLLGMVLDPNYVTNNRIYVLYTHDAAIGATAPRWGSSSSPEFDGCPTPPGATGDGCVVSGRLSRITLDGTPNPPEQVLIEDWCQQYPSHSVGNLEFDSAGNLYATAGDGASFNFADWGQDGNPLNPCGDPPGGVGAVQTAPTAQGGALRSQDMRTSGDPQTLDGSVIRINPQTGAGVASNPNAASADANARRIIAYGLRNPFRFAISPDDELWIGDVGWNTWEELNRMPASPASTINFGWPCYEGAGRQSGYDQANLSICENLYTEDVLSDPVTPPALTYNHSAKVVAGETCPTGSSSVSGVDFYEGGPFPAAYDDALFFSDYSRDCIWVIRAGTNGLPNTGTVTTFATGNINPTFVQAGLDGALYYTNFDGGTIQRIAYTGPNTPPTADASASPTNGPAPLTVNFNGSGSSDPDPGDTLDYAWDFDGNGSVDSTAVSPSHVYSTPGTFFAKLTVTDDEGNTGSDTVRIDAGNNPPTPTINTPSASLRWAVDDLVNFSGAATDPQQGALPASALKWELILDHCPSNCHQHPVQTFNGIGSGSFSAPDHEYPSKLILRLTATDAQGATASKEVVLDPQTVQLTIATQPSGLEVGLNAASGAAPLTRTVIKGSMNSIGADSPQTLGGRSYDFVSWSDGGQETHSVIANADRTITARFNTGPTATATANPTSGNAPLAVQFSGSASSDPDAGDSLDYAWDLDGDGQYDDSSLANPQRTYGAGDVQAGLRVTDDQGETDTDSVLIHAANTAPTPQISTPSAGKLWSAGESIGFSGGATDAQDGPLAGPALDWELRAGGSTAATFPDRASGTFVAPERTDPTSLTLRLTATDSNGASATIERALDPKTVALTLASAPPGLDLELNGEQATAPFTESVVAESTNTIAASSQPHAGSTHWWKAWSDGGQASHQIEASQSRTLTASFEPNRAPSAAIDADPTGGPAPLTVNFDGTGSSDPDGPLGDSLTYAWDLDGDGDYDDSTASAPQRTYSGVGTVAVGLEVTDEDGAADTAVLAIEPGNDPPVATIDAPAAVSRWSAGETIGFSGSASDPQEGTLGADALDWTITSGGEQIATATGATGTFVAPDGPTPAPLTLKLTATDGHGLSGDSELVLDPRTVDLTLTSQPSGLQLGLNGEVGAAPFSRTVVEGSTNALSAPSPQPFGGTAYEWSSWSDGGTAAHSFTADASRTLSASFTGVRGEPAPRDLRLETLRVRIPKSIERLIERGGRAKLLCNLSCRVTMKLVANGRAARELGIAGTIGRATIELEADTPTKLTTPVRKWVVRKIEARDLLVNPRVRARFRAR